MPAPYRLFKRSNSPYWYVQFRDADGSRTTAKSSGERLKKDAEDWAAEQFRTHGYQKPPKRIKFGEYAEDWWKPDKCRYVRRRRAEGMNLSDGYIAAARGLLENHILPTFKNRTLASISRSQIEDWKLDLFENSGLAPQTVTMHSRCSNS